MVTGEAKKGSAEMLVLGLVEEEPRHGYEIARLIESRSRGAIVFNSATLYPTLYRLEAKGLITGRWVEKAGQRRRRYYRITPAGRRAVAEQRAAWTTFLGALSDVAKLGEV